MGLLDVVVRLIVGMLVLAAVSGVALLDAERVLATVRRPQTRIREVGPHLGLLAFVLVLNRIFRHLGQELSWLIGLNITGAIFAIEGTFVAAVQSVATPAATQYFTAVYLYGYAFLVVFPFVAYWVLEDPTPLRKTIVAYAVNYALGLVAYTLFIAYGPRNLLPSAVEPLLYATSPEVQLLTSKVNANTNVFPSLHTSLSVTVLLLAAKTREEYFGWFLLSILLAGSVVVSTMYLGIHWVTDVAAGAVVAVVSVRLAERYHEMDVGEYSQLAAYRHKLSR